MEFPRNQLYEKYFDSIDYFISYIIKQEYGEIGLDWFGLVWIGLSGGIVNYQI